MIIAKEIHTIDVPPTKRRERVWIHRTLSALGANRHIDLRNEFADGWHLLFLTFDDDNRLVGAQVGTPEIARTYALAEAKEALEAVNGEVFPDNRPLGFTSPQIESLCRKVKEAIKAIEEVL